jgi:hypothetical protein
MSSPVTALMMGQRDEVDQRLGRPLQAQVSLLR